MLPYYYRALLHVHVHVTHLYMYIIHVHVTPPPLCRAVRASQHGKRGHEARLTHTLVTCIYKFIHVQVHCTCVQCAGSKLWLTQGGLVDEHQVDVEDEQHGRGEAKQGRHKVAEDDVELLRCLRHNRTIL